MRHSYLPFLFSRIRSSTAAASVNHHGRVSQKFTKLNHSRFYSSSIHNPQDATSSVNTSSSTSTTAFDGKHISRTTTGIRQYRPPVRPYPLTTRKIVTDPNIMKPPYADTGIVPSNPYHDAILIHNDVDDLQRMKHAAKIARRILDYACSLARPGITTDEIDTAVHNELLKKNAYPSPLNYVGFPKSLCSSINEVICHGIPDTRPLQYGDVVSFDVSCFVGGVHGDNCATILVGDLQEEDEIGTDWRNIPYKNHFENEQEEIMFRAARRLIHATRESLYEAIHRIGPGSCLTDIGNAIQDVADAYGYSTVEKYRGHGIGEVFHCPPYVKHYRNHDRQELVPGMIFTIEPMLVEGSGECYEWDDHWTVATVDGGMSAQFEHTVLILEDGVEILTVPDDEDGKV